MSKGEILWRDLPEDHDYPAALSYLSLTFKDADAKRLVSSLKRAPMVSFKAKDVARASCLPLLGSTNKHVAKSIQKIHDGEKLSPILLIRHGGRVIVADGFHRLSVVHLLDEDANIPCKIA